MFNEKPTQYKILKRHLKKWINLVIKANKGYELDDKEIKILGEGFMVFDMSDMPKDIKTAIKNAEKYYHNNNLKK